MIKKRRAIYRIIIILCPKCAKEISDKVSKHYLPYYTVEVEELVKFMRYPDKNFTCDMCGK